MLLMVGQPWGAISVPTGWKGVVVEIFANGGWVKDLVTFND